MRGASAEALAALQDQLRQVLGGTDAARVGDDLFGAATVLRSEAALRRVATDVSTDAEAKAGLVRSIFEGKVDPASLDLLAEASRRRWTATRDLPDSLERLSEEAAVRSAGGDAARVSDELFVVTRSVQDNPGLRDALADASRPVGDRAALVDGLLGGKALPATVTLAKQALGGGYRSITVALEEYQKVAAAVQDERVAEVRSAHPLTDADRERLERALARQYGRDVHLNVVVDPSLLGGLRVEIGDDVIDGTVSARLDQARRKLAG